MSYQIWCESKLLAVDDECGSALVEELLAVEASVLHQVNSRLLRLNSKLIRVDVVCVCADLRLILRDSDVVGWDAVLKCCDVGLEFDHGEAHRLKGDHDLCLGLQGALVVVCVEDRLAHVEGVDRNLEGACGSRLAIRATWDASAA